jgi:starch phosphorylase
VRAIRRFTVRVTLPEPLAALHGLMLNLRWSWHGPTADLFASIDPAAWAASGGDPIAMLSALPSARIAALATDGEFLARLGEAERDLQQYMSGPRWYATAGPAGPGAQAGIAPAAIAYFSPEYGITAALPQYSGGLGILAGDHLKSASDLGVPLIGVGLLYRHGYFTQSLSADGWQAERYPSDDPNGLPLELLRDAAGAPVHVTVGLTTGRQLSAQIWVAQVGRVPLLLLDSYVEANEADLHEVTDRLYGGGSDHRLRQELLLGVGGVRAVRAFCTLRGYPSPEVFHTNEGHAGFLGLERIREYAEQGLSFDEALQICRAGTVFTTHTPVPAGIDRFERSLVREHFADDPLLPIDRVLALGAETYPGGDHDVFNMAVMGMRLAQRVNGVSLLHGQVSREMFAGLWPGFDTREVPIGSVTNGVHTPTWVAPEIGVLAVLAGGDDPPKTPALLAGGATPQDPPDPGGTHPPRPPLGGITSPQAPLAPLGEDWERAADAPAAELWETRHLLRARLVAETRRRLRASWRQRGASDAELTWIDDVLDENVLTIGFARRVPSYKRLTLMLNDPAMLSQLLNDPVQPLQIVVAGKAHPADEGGKGLIQQMVQFSDSPDVRRRLVFLPDYDMAMAHALVQGCDVWLNNPLRPLEACGTSGMKAALNGGLNVSVRDGWWDEWYDGGNGWEIPSADGVADPARRDALEATALYELLGKSVAPLFYDRDQDGIPPGWVERIRHTFRSLGPKVQAERMVREYVTELYMPAAVASRNLDGAEFGPARELAAWRQRVVRAWPQLRVEHVEAEAAGQALGSALTVRVSVALGELTPDDVLVEVVYGRPDDADEIVSPAYATLTAESAAANSLARFSGEVPLDQPGPFGYTVRVLPNHPLLNSRAELGLVTYPQAPAGMTNGDLRLAAGARRVAPSWLTLKGICDGRVRHARGRGRHRHDPPEPAAGQRAERAAERRACGRGARGRRLGRGPGGHHLRRREGLRGRRRRQADGRGRLRRDGHPADRAAGGRDARGRHRQAGGGRDHRLRPRRRARDRARRRLPGRGRGRPARPARDPARHHPRSRRDAAAAPPGRPGQGQGHRVHGPDDQGRGGARHRPGRPGRAGRFGLPGGAGHGEAVRGGARPRAARGQAGH